MTQNLETNFNVKNSLTSEISPKQTTMVGLRVAGGNDRSDANFESNNINGGNSLTNKMNIFKEQSQVGYSLLYNQH